MSLELENIVEHLQLTAELNQEIQQQGLSSHLRDLQNWQCQRLIATHQALLSNKKYKPAMEFFIDELYGPKDFAQRDDDIARIVPKMSKILPAAALKSLEQALHLNALSLQLDYQLVLRLKDEASIDAEKYAAAYLDCDNYEDRAQQIDFIAELGNDLADVTNIIGIGMLLKMSRKPAQLAGFLALHEFLEHGFNAFKKIGKVEDFINPIVNKEREIMDQLFRGENNLPDVRI
ncbi:hypothetical protein EYS14_10020 [Alteromonadaceae bacterium M269]|nr:hypothetical protein EYS14_10020 [Alteromonadaceae bacterium M269]